MVTTLFKKSLNAINSKQTNIFSAAFFIILTTVASQILGIVKYRLLAYYFGSSKDKSDVDKADSDIEKKNAGIPVPPNV